MPNISNFITHSHYPQEKIVWSYEGTIDNTNPYWRDESWATFGGLFIPLPDGLDFESFLPDGVWSVDDWQTSYPVNTYGNIAKWEQDPDQPWMWSMTRDSAGISLLEPFLDIPEKTIFLGSEHDSPHTAKIRAWAYLKSDDMASYTTQKTAEQMAHNLQKTTSLAQMNLISENVMFVPPKETTTLYHNLGFKPYCKIWLAHQYWHYKEWQINSIPSQNINDYQPQTIVKVDENKISIYNEDADGFYGTQEFLVRIYGYSIS